MVSPIWLFYMWHLASIPSHTFLIVPLATLFDSKIEVVLLLHQPSYKVWNICCHLQTLYSTHWSDSLVHPGQFWFFSSYEWIHKCGFWLFCLLRKTWYYDLVWLTHKKIWSRYFTRVHFSMLWAESAEHPDQFKFIYLTKGFDIHD